MSVWNKKDVSKEIIRNLHIRYGVNALTASILARRGITKGEDVLYFLEDDIRFQHNPFSFAAMEDAVDRILSAREEKEKVLIFGDRDVDGVSSAALLYFTLKNMGLDVKCRLPEGDDGYGLSAAAVNEFASQGGTLIITVDCGISNNAEVALAFEHFIDVIIVDHHNPPDKLPAPAIIIDSKLKDSGYPFPDISGCAVAYKLARALRFSKMEQLYKEDICLLNVRPINGAYTIECVKVRNMVKRAHLEETIIPGSMSIDQTRLARFLEGQHIFVWDKEIITKQLARVFGGGVEFNIFDLRPEVANLIPAIARKSLLAIKDMSKIAKYTDDVPSEIDGFYNIFVTFLQKKQENMFPDDVKADEMDMQLVALAAIADIMPLKNENRIFVRRGLESINAGKIRPGLLELMSRVNTSVKRLTSTDLTWNITPALNAAGRLGHPELALNMFLSDDASERGKIAAQILELNAERKRIMLEANAIADPIAKKSIEDYGGKLCVIIDERINRGITGILASRLVKEYGVPAIIVTFTDDKTAVGSMRSCKNYDSTVFLNQFGDIFINHGGHTYAAGFSFKRDRLNEFKEKLSKLAPTVELVETDDSVSIDAELPVRYMTPELLSLVDLFEPFGHGNDKLIFMSKSLKIADVQVFGKTERQHLKITFDCGKVKWPAIYWGAAERLHKDFEISDRLDVIYNITRNVFNGMESPQMVLLDLKRSEER